MKSVSLLYHDVVEPGCDSSSGFAGADADIYKLNIADFEHHLDAIAATGSSPCAVRSPLSGAVAPGAVPLFLTFDDGGASASSTADLLDKRGWKGHFFITTDRIGAPAFVTAQQIRDLHARGHLIGSHSCSHPHRISFLSDPELAREWRQSICVLENILGEPVTTASVPGGFYSPRVARFAASAGIRLLFNSEPKIRSVLVSGCTVLGRFGLQHDSPPQRAAHFAARDPATRLRESAFWNSKKLLKAAGGQHWLSFRKWWLAR